MRNLFFITLIFLITGCMTTSYQTVNNVNSETKPNPPFSKNVIYRVADDLYKEAPDCILIWPTRDPKMPDVEAAVARFASGRFIRVIGPNIRDREAKKRGLNIENVTDLKTLSHKLKCSSGLQITAGRKSRDYLVVWSQQSLFLTLTLKSVNSDKILWQAQHTASRSSGGLPLSPVSLAINAAEAGLHQADKDVADSLIDDALRRMIITLPDLR